MPTPHQQMKKIAIVLALVCLSALPALAQRVGYSPKKNALRFSPIYLVGNTFELSYEKYFNKGKTSLVFTPGLFLRENRWDAWSNERSEKGFLATTQLRFYYSVNEKMAKKPVQQSTRIKLFAGPYYRMRYQEDNYREFGRLAGPEFSFEDGNDKFQDIILANEGGFIFGFQTITFDRLIFDVYFGGGYKHTQAVSDNPFGPTVSDGFFAVGYSGVIPRGNVQIGFAF